LTSLGGISVPSARLIYRGAEADVYLGPWCGGKAVFKFRKKLEYRLDVLDRAIRTQRTVHESDMIHRVKAAGVPSPFLYFVDPRESLLVMEYVEGVRMKDVVSTSPPATSLPLFRKLGGMVATLHANGIMHGDLTTSNVIVDGGRLVMIDFGLSITTSRVEDQAVDLRLIKETITGAHSEVAQDALKSLFEGYEAVAGERTFRSVARQLKDIERRGRYARVE